MLLQQGALEASDPGRLAGDEVPGSGLMFNLGVHARDQHGQVRFKPMMTLF